MELTERKVSEQNEKKEAVFYSSYLKQTRLHLS